MPQDAPPRRSARVLTLVVVVVGALAVLGTIAFWPRGDAPDLGDQPTTYVDATVTAIDTDTCQDPEIDAPGPCQVVSAELHLGRRPRATRSPSRCGPPSSRCPS